MERTSRPGTGLRLAELLAAVSLVTDLGMGQPPGSAMRGCLLATALARRRHLPEDEVRSVFYTTLLRYLGCTAYAHEEAVAFGGDDVALRVAGALVDEGNAREMLPFLLFRPGRGLPLPRRVLVVVRGLLHAEGFGTSLAASHCEVAARLADRLGLPEAVQRGVHQVMERWDGTGGPAGLAGEEAVPAARLALLASRIVLFEHELGPEAAREMVRAWSGRVFDPELAAAFLDGGTELLAQATGPDLLRAVRDAEPPPRTEVGEERIDAVAQALGDMVELKIPYLRGDTRGVAGLAEEAARRLGLGETEATALRRAGHLHDIGAVGVANGTWERPSRPSTGEWEQMRLHPYHGERVLAHAAVLRSVASLVGAHHERLDGSGYHRQAKAPELTLATRILAAADAYRAMIAERPYRAALDADRAAADLRSEARAGRLDPEAVDAVLAAAGHAGTRRVRHSWPAALSDREVEVLRLLARGAPDKRMAKELGISPKTVGHHVQHIYDKLGVSTRAGATLFAMESGLVR